MTCGKEDIPLDQVGPHFYGGEEIGGKERERKEREEEKRRERLLIHSRFLEDPTVGIHRSKGQSRSPWWELRVETGIGEFRQTPRGGDFSYSVFIPSLKAI